MGNEPEILQSIAEKNPDVRFSVCNAYMWSDAPMTKWDQLFTIGIRHKHLPPQVAAPMTNGIIAGINISGR
jgi:hypothetical protein